MQLQGRLLAACTCASLFVATAGCFTNTRLGTGSSAAQIVSVGSGATAPSANLLISLSGTYAPTQYLDVHIGDTVEFYWNGSGADTFSSTYTQDAASTCPGATAAGTHLWVASNTQGSTSRDIQACEAGRTYLYVYTITDSLSGNMSAAMAMVHVLAQTPPANSAQIEASINVPAPGEFAGPAGLISANPGESLHLTWQSSGAGITNYATYAVDSPDACGDPSQTFPNVASANGQADLTLQPCMAGHTYTITYQALNGGAVAASSELVIKVRANPALADPHPVLTLNGIAGVVTAKVGDTINYAWSATNADLGDSSILVSGTSIQGDCADDDALGTLRRPWQARSAGGSLPAVTVPACRAGKTYTIVYTATESATGKSISTTLVVNFVQAQ